MKLRKPLIITAIALTGLLAGGATPASADTTGVTFALLAGSLTLSVAPTATLGDEVNIGVGAEIITGSLGPVTVIDDRGGAIAWNVTAVSTAFTGALGSTSTLVTYTGGTVTETGTITVADGAATTISGAAAAVVSPSTLSGNNTATWTPTLDVTMQAGARVDTYSGTVTTSFL